MKYLLFKDPSKDYGITITKSTVGVLQQGFAEVSDGVAEDLLQDSSVVEITAEQFLNLKKKLTDTPVSYRQLSTQPQDPTRDPLAHYAEEPKEVDPEPDVIDVGPVELDSPLEQKSAPKKKRGRRK